MNCEFTKSLLGKLAITATALLAGSVATAQTTVNLTAARSVATLPDGSVVKMWSYCQPNATSTPAVTCPTDGSGAWSPGPTIIVPTDPLTGLGSLTITLTNALPVATSLVILGQIGDQTGQGGATANDVPRIAFPQHGTQGAITWPAKDPSAAFTPPTQLPRASAFATETAPGTTSAPAYTWAKLRPGTYLYETGSLPSLQAPMGLYGVIVVTSAPTATAAGEAYPKNGVTTPRAAYDADATVLFSEIDPRQNAAVDAAAMAGASVTTLFNDASCATTACYPPVVNYAPTYFLINGKAFDPGAPNKAGIAFSGNVAFTGQVLVRMVNAGLHTHVPSIVGQTLRLVGEDGNFAPGVPKKQSHILMAAGKTYDALMSPAAVSPATTPATYANGSFPIFDRALSLTSGNLDRQSVMSNSGMMAFLAMQPAGTAVGDTVGGGAAVPTALLAALTDDVYATAVNAAFNGNVLKNDVNVSSAALAPGGPSHGAVVFNSDGTFAYTPALDYVGPDSFTYTGTGATGTATVTIKVGSALPPKAVADAFTSAVASVYKSSAPGVLANDTANDGITTIGLKASLDSIDSTCSSVDLQPDGSFTAVPMTAGVSCTFHYHAIDALGAVSATVDAAVAFSAGSGLAITVQDTQDKSTLQDYSWVIEQDNTFFHDPKNPTAVNTLATNFHKSYMPVIASGCTGPNSCGDLNTVGGTSIAPRARSWPKDVKLDAGKRYFVSILPGDADQGDAQYNADGSVVVNSYGHTMGGVQIAAGQLAATVLVPRNPLPPAQLSVIVFEDNNPINGGVDDNEQGLGGFTVNLYDTRGSSGDPAGLMTYDLSAMPFTNSLANQKDSATGVNLCPLTTPSGTIITCPERDSRGQPSPLAGMALVKNINPGRYDVWATPGADRAVKGEHWIQVSTLEGTHANDTFIKPGEPAYWQEFGPPGFHSFIGFVNPDHINAVNAAQSPRGVATVTGRVPSLHMDRPRPLMATLNNSCATGTNADGSAINSADTTCRATLSSTPCYVAVNSNAGAGGNPTVAMATCDANGNFELKNVPAGQQELVIWDQWLDQIIAYKALTVPPATPVVIAGDIPVFSWFTRVDQSAYQDLNQNGVRDPGEPGVSQIPMNIRFRDGSISNFLTSDSSGWGGTNELFPLFNWYVLESDTTRFTGTGVFTAYDAGGKPDAAATTVTDLNGDVKSLDVSGLLNSNERYPLDTPHQIGTSTYTPNSTVRIDSGATLTEGTQGYINQTSKVDWGKRPYVPGENGGITGMVYYASTRGFDDPSLEVQFSWEPGVADVPVNLYQEVKNADGSVTRVLVDQTTTWSWDKSAATLNCPGEPDYNAASGGDPFINVTLAQAQMAKNQTAASAKTVCYDGQHSFNQIQPAVYDGRYKFPSANCTTTMADGSPNTFTATNGQTVTCATIANPANSRTGLPKNLVPSPAVLPNGSYVVELQVPQGYEIVKEEDKNILIGDTYIAPFANTQFMGVGNVFIVPDQATLNDANVPGANLASAFPPCVGVSHLVPDYLSLFPDSGQDSPYAGQLRPLCDHKEVGVTDQGQGGADFQLFTQTPIAGHISGIMLNDAAAEFDPYNPAFLEKASLPNAPISVRDYNGIEIQRIYNDRYGTFNNLVPSTWEANIPNPSGYAPNVLTYCMNDPGPIPDPAGTLDPKTGAVRLIADPMYNPMFSNFCYNWPDMPGITTYLDTPVLPVSAYASESSYEPVDCAYPASTPGIYRVDGTDRFSNSTKTDIGPVVDLALGRTLVITALGTVQVSNPAYEGPNAAADPTHPTVNQPKILRHYGFGPTPGKVQVGTLTLNVASGAWADGTITATVPAEFDGSVTGELVITTGGANPLKSIDTVTVTIGRKIAATYVGAPDLATSGANALPHPIQDAIDAAKSGDLIIVDSGNYSELVILDRPLRLQGVGAAAVVINATKYPNQKIEQWRTRINNLFGLDNQGNALPGLPGSYPAVDPLPGQEITGGVVLLEPSVLATEEGAGITVLAKAYRRNGNLLDNGDCGNVHNFLCKNARIDGLSVTGGDAGGGIYVNGWAHNLEISNNRVYGNAGPFSGGVRVGQPYLEGTAIDRNFTGFAYDRNIQLHNNAITNNGTVEGNAAAAAPGAAAGGAGGGLSICAGSDGYKVTGNWICGNYSSSDGGGIGHIGLSNNGLIQGNKILFNESYNQSGAQFGGGVAIEGEGATGTTLALGTGNVTVDQNLILGNFARAGSGGGIRLQSVNGGELGVLAGNGHWSVAVTNNMIVNNMAAWAGAGISLADTLYSNVVGNTVASNDSTGIAGNLFNTQLSAGNTGPTTGVPNPAGISTELTSAPLLAALPNSARAANRVSDPHLVNDIVWHNRSFFFNMDNGNPQLSPSNLWSDALLGVGAKPTLGTPGLDGCTTNDKYWDVGVVGDMSAATPAASGPITTGITSATQSTSGLNRVVTVTTSAALGMPAGTVFTVTISGVSGSLPIVRALYNVTNAAGTVTGTNAFTYRPVGIGVNNSIFANLNFTTAHAAVTPPASAQFPVGNSLLSSGADPQLAKLYCNAARATPGLQFEPGTAFQPAFTISVSATLDESGNYVDLHFGPLSLQDQATGTTTNGNYHLAGASGGAYDTGSAPTTALPYATRAFDGDVRPQGAAYDKGADEVAPPAPIVTLSTTSLNFSGAVGAPVAAQTIILTNTGAGALTGILIGTSGQFSQTNNCPPSLGFATGSNSCTITVTFTRTNTGSSNGTLSIADNAVPSPQTVALSGTMAAPSVRGAWSPSPAVWTSAQTGANFDQVITLTANAGNNAPLTIGSVPVANSSGGRFSVVSNACTTGLSLAAGGTCSATVRYVTRGTNQQRNAGASLSVATNSTTPANGTISDALNGG